MKENLKGLDGLRGLAALYVLIHHARLALTQPYFKGLASHPEKYEWYDRLMVYFFGFFKFGHEAVIIFFVLSGFLIHLKQAGKNYDFVEFKFIKYLKKRIVRIYPTLLVSFVLCLFTDYLIYQLTDNRNILSKYTFSNFLFNFFLVPDAPIWGNNYPVWSLKHEWFFYLIYPLLLLTSQKSKLLPIIIVLSFFMLYLFNIKIPFIGAAAYTLMIWTLGAVLAMLYQNKTKSIGYIPYLTCLIFIYPILNRENIDVYPLLDLCFGLISVGITALIISGKVSIINKFLVAMSWLGTFSYSLYLLHSPIFNLFKEIILQFDANHQLPYHLWYVLLAILISIPVIYVIYYYTERIAINYKKRSF